MLKAAGMLGKAGMLNADRSGRSWHRSGCFAAGSPPAAGRESAVLLASALFACLAALRVAEHRCLAVAHLDLSRDRAPPSRPGLGWLAVRELGTFPATGRRIAFSVNQDITWQAEQRCVRVAVVQVQPRSHPCVHRLVAERAWFRRACDRAGIGAFHPHELRHSWVSLLSDAGVDIEAIADAAGHSSSTVTREVYRHRIAPELSAAAVAMDRIFGAGSAS